MRFTIFCIITGENREHVNRKAMLHREARFPREKPENGPRLDRVLWGGGWKNRMHMHLNVKNVSRGKLHV